VPIINENDTVSTEEIRFGDNDTLSALVVNLVKADLLILLTDTPGLMTEDPRRGEGKLIREVLTIGPEIEACARDTQSARGTGGMASKLKAVKMVVTSGEPVIIAHGLTPHLLERLFDGEEIGTFFHPGKGKLKGRKRWIAFFVKPAGKIIVDKGAAEALIRKGKSLLAPGVVAVEGGFQAGDTVGIFTEGAEEIARGLTNFSAAELAEIKGRKSSEIGKLFERKRCNEIVHRDNLVLLAR
jgi:glutamate 5-kinase